MIENINFSEIFISKLKSYYGKYKKNNGSIKKHFCQNRFLMLHRFISNSCYWSRFNKDSVTGKWFTDCITGKYLNEIHLFLVKFNFYRSLYCCILNIYLKLTNYETLKNISIDSCFIRNIQGYNLSRNPIYHNKPGLKIHALVDSFRVPISFIVTDCNLHDSIIVQKLIESSFIDKNIFSNYCQTFLADSAYSGFITVEYITSIGLNILIGRNNQHVRKIININTASTDDLKNYKKRGIVENFFGNFLRTPCLINNYERSLKSYEGIALLYMSIYLSKKINKIIDAKNNTELKINNEKLLLAKKKANIERKLRKSQCMRARKERAEREKIERNIIINDKIKNIKNKIWNNVNKSQIKRSYNKSVRLYNNRIKIKKRGREKNNSYDKYEQYMKDELYRYVKDNVLTNTYSYMFSDKKLHIIKAESYAFKDNTINRKMNNTNINKVIKLLTDKFFD